MRVFACLCVELAARKRQRKWAEEADVTFGMQVTCPIIPLVGASTWWSSKSPRSVFVG